MALQTRWFVSGCVIWYPNLCQPKTPYEFCKRNIKKNEIKFMFATVCVCWMCCRFLYIRRITFSDHVFSTKCDIWVIKLNSEAHAIFYYTKPPKSNFSLVIYALFALHAGPTLVITAIGITNGVHAYMLDIPSSELASTSPWLDTLWFTGKGLPFDGYTPRSVWRNSQIITAVCSCKVTREYH